MNTVGVFLQYFYNKTKKARIYLRKRPYLLFLEAEGGLFT